MHFVTLFSQPGNLHCCSLKSRLSVKAQGESRLSLALSLPALASRTPYASACTAVIAASSVLCVWGLNLPFHTQDGHAESRAGFSWTHISELPFLGDGMESERDSSSWGIIKGPQITAHLNMVS